MSRSSKIKYLLSIASDNSIVSFYDIVGTESRDVTSVQRHLLDSGYDIGPTGADGIFGSKTKAGLEDFQRINKMDITGEMDEDTIYALSNPGSIRGDQSDRYYDLRDKLLATESESDKIDIESELHNERRRAPEELRQKDTGRISSQALYNELYSRLGIPNLCIAMVANAVHESSLEPGAIGDCGSYGKSHSSNALRIRGRGMCCSYGLWQYNICGGMGVDYLEANGNPKLDEDKLKILADYDKQISYMVSYLASKHSSELQKNKTVKEWTSWFVRKVERPADIGGAIASRTREALNLSDSLFLG
jgi:hypothetical protein